MKDKAIFKKWWFWVIVGVIVLGVIGAAGQPGSENANTDNSTDTTTKEQDANPVANLPQLNASDYEGKEGLVVYKYLKAQGYTVDAEFENEALTDINGKASDLFEPLDENDTADRLSVDAFVIGGLEQTGDSVKLVVVKSSN